MEQLRPYLVSIVAVVVAVVLGLVTYVAFISHEGKKLNTLNAQKASLQQSVQQLTAQINSLREENQQLPKNCKALVQDLTEIPTTPQFAAFYKQLTVLATDAGTSIPAVTITSASAPVAPTTSASGTASPAAALTPITLTLTVSGDYQQVGLFLSGLDKSFSRLFIINGFSLGTTQSSSTQDTSSPAFIGGQKINPTTPGYSLVLGGTIYYSPGEVNVCNQNS